MEKNAHKCGGRFAVIMAGGRGERLWPLSIPERPKQFLKLSEEGTMLQQTVERILALVPKEEIYIAIPERFKKLTFDQLDLPAENLIVEPVGRNTAPCIGLAAIMLEAKDPHGVMVVLPADHVIKKRERFLEILKRAIEVAKTGNYLVTLGIVPDHPATGYGYIHCGPHGISPYQVIPQGGELFGENDGIEVYRVQRFTEKPSENTAERFLSEGGYYWNSGMFIWRVDVILAEIEQRMPQLYAGLQEIKEHLDKPDRDIVIRKVYQEQEPISIDYGVMERSSRALMIPADIGWSDVGDWSALDALFEKDENENIVQANHLAIDTINSVVYSTQDRPVATIGLDNIVIIETEEALLVMDKARAQEVREIVKKIKKDKQPKSMSP